MSDALAERRALVKRAVDELRIPFKDAMKLKSARIHEMLNDASKFGIYPSKDDEMTETVVPTPVEPAIPVDGNADPEAPYGRKADGTPKAKPGRKGGPAGAATPRQAAPKPVKRAGARARVSVAPDYRPGIVGLLQIPAFILTSAGRFKPELEYDGIAVMGQAPAIAEAVNSLAQDEPRVAAVLDKVLAAGPYGALLGALVPLVAQVAVNHKRIPAGTMGTVEPEVLKSAFVEG